MPIFFTGCGMFVVGVLLNFVGWEVHKRRKMGDDGKDWFFEVLRQWFGTLTGKDSTPGERIAAFGTIVAAFGVVVALAGLGVWVANS